MFGTREFRFSYTDENGELRYIMARNQWLAQRDLQDRGMKFTDLKRAPFPKNKPLTTGTCQICGREIGTTVGLIAHHGYTRPGHGWQTSSCFGARWRAYEVACDALPPAIASVTAHRDYHQAAINNFIAEPPAKLVDVRRDAWGNVKSSTDYERPADFDPKAKMDRYDYQMSYSKLFAGITGDHQRQIDFSNSDIKTLTKRLADWKEPK
jgi:hypothetical protein